MATLGTGSADLTFQGVPLTAGGSVGTGGRSTTSSTPDPFRNFLLNSILQQQRSTGEVPDFTLQGIQKFTQDPGFIGDIAGSQFQQISRGLVDSLRPGEQREARDLQDLFRKAGVGTQQSGAFAQAGRQLVGDQAARRNQLLASNFVPLTSQLSTNFNEALKRGLDVPGATSESLRPLVGSLASLAPLSTTTESIGINPNVPTGNALLNAPIQPTPTLQFTI